MMRLGRLGLCVVAVLAIGAIAAAAASAEAPEYGRCIKKVKAEGSGFTGKTCTTAGSGKKAKYEWLAGPGEDREFTSEEKAVYPAKFRACKTAIGEEELAAQERTEAETAPEPLKAELEKRAGEHELASKQAYEGAGKGEDRAKCLVVIAGAEKVAPAKIVIRTTPTKTKVFCAHEHGTGEFSGAKTVANLTLTLTECALEGTACNSPLAEEGEIVTSVLMGQLGIISVEKDKHSEKIKTIAGIALEPTEGATVAEFSCGGSTFEVTGSVIREVASGKMLTREPNSFMVTEGGFQEPEQFMEQPADVLDTTIDGGPSEGTGLRLKSIQQDGEAIEVNTEV